MCCFVLFKERLNCAEIDREINCQVDSRIGTMLFIGVLLSCIYMQAGAALYCAINTVFIEKLYAVCSSSILIIVIAWEDTLHLHHGEILFCCVGWAFLVLGGDLVLCDVVWCC